MKDHLFFLRKQSFRSKRAGICPAPYLYNGLSETSLNIKINCVLILKKFSSMPHPLNDSLTLPLCLTVKQDLLFTDGNMWRLIFNHLSKMAQLHVPAD